MKLISLAIKATFALFLPFFLIACSGKVQTNKIPQDTKYHLPNKIESKELSPNKESLNDFKKTLEEFFKIENTDEGRGNIYKTGLERGHFK